MILAIEEIDDKLEQGETSRRSKQYGDQPTSKSVSRTSDYPKYLSKIDGIIDQWNQRMANFDQ